MRAAVSFLKTHAMFYDKEAFHTAKYRSTGFREMPPSRLTALCSNSAVVSLMSLASCNPGLPLRPSEPLATYLEHREAVSCRIFSPPTVSSYPLEHKGRCHGIFTCYSSFESCISNAHCLESKRSTKSRPPVAIYLKRLSIGQRRKREAYLPPHREASTPARIPSAPSFQGLQSLPATSLSPK